MEQGQRNGLYIEDILRVLHWFLDVGTWPA